MSMPWPEGCQLVSHEEKDYRWWYFKAKRKPSLAKFNKKIAKIRKKTGKP